MKLELEAEARAARISVQSLGFILRGEPLKGLEPGREVAH